jgi:uncharacterized iron-regulated membrane protein
MSGRVRHWLKRLHLWFGLSLGIVFALVALSGSVLVFETPLLRLAHPQLAAHALPDASQRAAVLARIVAQWQPQGLRSADFPTAELPVWQLYFRGDVRRYLDPADGHLLLTRNASSDVLLWLRSLHTHLLAGHTGERVLGALGWLMLCLLLSGVVLWWPRRGQLRSHLRPYTQPPTRRWLSWHRSLGALSLPLLLLVTLTGTLMVYHGATERTLRTLFAEPARAPAPPPLVPRDAPIDWAAVLAAAQGTLPGAELHRIALPKTDDARVSIRARARGEWHPVGRSEVWLDPYDARVLAASDATRSGPGTRLAHAVYPLHAGGSHWAWRLLVAFAGLLPPFFLVTGFLFWRARTRKRPAA